MFGEQYPHIHFYMEGGGLKILLDQIESASADFGIANLKDIPETLTYHKLFGTAPVLITQKKEISSPSCKGVHLGNQTRHTIGLAGLHHNARIAWALFESKRISSRPALPSP
jgi:hypothetical protein